MGNKEDLQAINSYVQSRSRPAAGAPATIINKWESLVNQWNSWYPKVMSSWYVSDEDLANGKAIRNALMRNNNPDTWQYVQETAADTGTGTRLSYAERPDAPKKTSTPWVQKGLTYSGKYATKDQVKVLQSKINAAGYKPALKVDGVYGPKTQAGERWYNLKKVDVKAEEAVDVIKKAVVRPTAAIAAPKPPAEDVADEEGEALVKPPSPRLFGVPINLKSIGGAVAGGVGGLLVGGPWGAAVGVPVGFVGGGKLLSKDEYE